MADSDDNFNDSHFDYCTSETFNDLDVTFLCVIYYNVIYFIFRFSESRQCNNTKVAARSDQ